MKVRKTQAVLYIFNQLMKHKQIRKADIQDTLSISDLAFRRYLQELRAFLVNFDEEYVLVYSKNDEIYYLLNGK